MNQVISPLRPQMKKAAVADLHEALTRLGFSIDAGERSSRRFGSSTRAAVSVFQRKGGQSATGIVDDSTATAINGALENGIPGGTALVDQGASRQVTGLVSHADGTPLRGLTTQASSVQSRAMKG